MSATGSVSRCSFTFADGRQCRMPRQSGHPFLCCFHARREAQSHAADQVGHDIRFFLSGDYLSAGDLSLALGRVFAATAQGQLKPKTAGTLAYLGQTLLQTIHHAENEYINAFSTDRWRQVIHTHVNENSRYLFPTPPHAEAPLPVVLPVPVEAASKTPDQAHASVDAGLQPGLSGHANASVRAKLSQPNLQPAFPHSVSPSAKLNSSQASQQTIVSNPSAVSAARSSTPTQPGPASSPAAASSPTSPRLPRRAAKFASTVLASAPSCTLPPARTQTSTAAKPPVRAPEATTPTGPSGLPILAAVPPRPPVQSARPDLPLCSAGFTPASSPEAAASPSNTRQPAIASSTPRSTSAPKPAAPPPTNNSSEPKIASGPGSPQPSPQPPQPSDLPGFGSPANWDVLIPQTQRPARRRRPIRPWHLPE